MKTPQTTILAFGALLTATLPAAATDGLYVADVGAGRILELNDLDLNNDFNGAGEVTVFYDGAIGSVNVSTYDVDTGPGGELYVPSSIFGDIAVLRDNNADGDAHDPGEAQLYFTTQNVGGISLYQITSLAVGPDGVVWVATADGGQFGGEDSIVRIEDLDGDGDADDVGEATLYYVAPGSAYIGNEQFTNVVVGLDGLVYFVENGLPNGRGVYRMNDLNDNGVIDAPNELEYYFSPIPLPGGHNYEGLTQTQDRRWFLTDWTSDVIWVFEDANFDGTINAATESSTYWTASGPSTLRALGVSADGSIYASETTSPDRILRFRDQNGNDVIEPFEVTGAYDETISSFDIVDPKGLCVLTGSAPPISYCTAKASSSGCLAVLTTSSPLAPPVSGAGNYSLVMNSAQGSRPGIFYGSTNGTATIPFNGGTLCVRPPLKRSPILFTGGTTGQCNGTFQLLINTGVLFPPPLPGGMDAGPGGTSWYQAWYRDPALMDGYDSAISTAVQLNWL